MSLPAGTGGEEHRGCGEDGCDCSLEGTAKHKQHKIHFLRAVCRLSHIALLF